MLIRFTGAVFIFLSCSLIGFYCGKKGHFRCLMLNELKSCLLILKSEINYNSNPLKSAFRKISEYESAFFSIFFHQMATSFEDLNNDFSSQWTEACRLFEKTHLSQDDISIIKSLGQNLGNIDIDVQISAIDMAILTIDNTTSILSKSNEKNSRMFNGLGVISGLLIVVVLF